MGSFPLIDLSAPSLADFTGQAPELPRSSCYGCPAHQFWKAGITRSCAVGRPQHSSASASANIFLRPASRSCFAFDVVESLPLSLVGNDSHKTGIGR
jgi:hypothetical protein